MLQGGICNRVSVSIFLVVYGCICLSVLQYQYSALWSVSWYGIFVNLLVGSFVVGSACMYLHTIYFDLSFFV